MNNCLYKKKKRLSIKFCLLTTLTAGKEVNELPKQDKREIPSTLKILQNITLPSLINTLVTL